MYHFIVNPNSRSGLGRQIWAEMEPYIQKAGIGYTVLLTKYQGHATQKVRELTSDQNEHTLVVLGGDGTVNEVINGICDFTKVTLGYIPTGSSNDFARGFHMQTDPLNALTQILQPTDYQYMDIGALSYRGKKRNFAVSAGIGFDAAICHQAVVSKLKVLLNKLKLGKLTYVGIALNRLFFSVPKPMSICLDHDQVYTFDAAYFTAVMNHPYEGGGFKFCPDAKPGDGSLDIIVISNIPKWKILLLLPTAFWGKHIFCKGVHTYSCKHISIAAARALPVHTDGEPLFLQQEVQASIEPKQLKIILTH